MTYVIPERGTKRICLSCEARFYDLGRVPAICPKCGVECAEIVRPPPTARGPRKRWPFGKDRVAEGEANEAPAPEAEASEDEEADEEAGIDRDDEAGEETEATEE